MENSGQISQAALDLGQLCTVALPIEACPNSKPITFLREDPGEEFAQSPIDCFRGGSLLAVRDIPSNRLRH